MEPLVHYVLPFIALLLFGEKPLNAFILAFLGLVPDVDALFNIHRSISHSVFVIGLIFVPLLIYHRLHDPGKMVYILEAFYAVITHLVLDLGGSTPLLWPLISEPASLRVAVYPPSFLNVRYPLFTQDGILISAVLLAPVCYNLLQKRQTSA